MPVDFKESFKHGKKRNRDLGDFVEQKGEGKEKVKGTELQEEEV